VAAFSKHVAFAKKLQILNQATRQASQVPGKLTALTAFQHCSNCIKCICIFLQEGGRGILWSHHINTSSTLITGMMEKRVF
jgi:hypothetical protein